MPHLRGGVGGRDSRFVSQSGPALAVSRLSKAVGGYLSILGYIFINFIVFISHDITYIQRIPTVLIRIASCFFCTMVVIGRSQSGTRQSVESFGDTDLERRIAWSM